MRKKSLSVLFFLIWAVQVFAQSSAEPIDFIYRYNAGDMYRILSNVESNIYINNRLSFRSEIVNRIGVEILNVQGERAGHSAVFQSAERTYPIGGSARPVPASHFTWSRDYNSEFTQDSLGYIEIEDRYFMPMVRNMPVFPGRTLNIGDSWTAEAIVVHDFRDSFGIEEPYRIPFTANYRYLGQRNWNGIPYPAFSIIYSIAFEPAPVRGRVYPLRYEANHNQLVYWNPQMGQVIAYEETFTTIITLSDGDVFEYRGSARAEIIESPPMDREEIVREIAEELEALDGVTVRVSDEGVVISLEDIQFAPDSALLLASEREKLSIIAEILSRYSGRDILVEGHTALAGTAQGRMQLSLERAEAVAAYLIGLGARRQDQVVIRGYGAERPVADNSTELGMQRNRRVEITILEN